MQNFYVIRKDGLQVPLHLEVADTALKRQQGLMNISQLNDRHGMYFKFDKPGHFYFWMRNTLIPLDILFLNEVGTILCIKQGIPHDDKTMIGCDQEAMSAIELYAGTVTKYNIQVGDRVVEY
jgi:uncharacterized protein